MEATHVKRIILESKFEICKWSSGERKYNTNTIKNPVRTHILIFQKA